MVLELNVLKELSVKFEEIAKHFNGEYFRLGCRSRILKSAITFGCMKSRAGKRPKLINQGVIFAYKT